MDTTLLNPEEITLYQLRQENEELKVRLAQTEQMLADVRSKKPSTDPGLNPVHSDSTPKLTEKKKSATGLIETNEHFSKTFNFSPMGINVFRLSDGRSLQVNQAYLSLIGYSEEEVIGHTAVELNLLVHPEDRDKWLAGLQEGKSIQNMELLVRKKSGQQVNVLMSLIRIEINGEKMGLIQTVDITERKKAEEDLRRSEKKFSIIYETSPYIISLSKLPDGAYVDVNEAFLKQFGFAKEEVIGKNSNELRINPKTGNRNKLLDEISNNGFAHDQEDTFYTKTGKERILRYNIDLVEIDNEKFILNTAEDITLQRQAEALKSKYETISKFARDPMLLMEVNGQIIEANNAAVKFYGYSYDELMTLNIFDIRVREEKNLAAEQMSHAKSDGIQFETIHRHKNGTIIPVEVSSKGVTIDGKEMLLSVIRDITERKQADQIIESNNRKIEEILSSIQDDFYVLDYNWNFTYANRTFTSKIGKEPEDFIGKNLWELFPMHIETEYDHNLRAAMENREIRRFEMTGKYTDKWFEMNVFPSSEGITVIGRDISEKKLTEIENHRAKEEWERTFNAIPDLIAIIDPNHRIVRANKAMAERIGLKENECAGQQCFKAIHNTTCAPDFCPHSKTLADGATHEVEIFEQQLKGDFIVTTTPLLDQKGDFIGSVHVARDISERKKSEELLRQSEERYKAIFVRSLSVMMIIDPDTAEIKDVNQAACDFYGWNYDEFCTKYISDVNIITREEAISNMQNAKNETQNHFIFKHQLANGEIRDVEVYSCPLEFNGDIALFAIIHDITESKKMEEALRESELRLKYHFENSPLAVVEWDSEFNVTQWSVEAEKIFGYTKEESIGKPIGNLNLIYEDDLPIVNHTMQRLTSGEEDTVVSSNRNVTKSGSIITTVWYNSILFDEKGGMKSIMSLVQDITAQKQAEEALVESEFFFRETQQAGSIGSYKTDFVNNKWESSDVLDLMFGIDKNYHRDFNSWLDIIHPDDRMAMRLLMTEEVLAKGTEFDHDFRIIRKSDGKQRWLHGLGKVRRDSNNNVILLVGTIQDITIKKIGEEALVKSEALFRESQQAANIGSYNTNFETGLWDSSEVMDQIFGIDNTYVKSVEGWLHIIYPDDRDMMYQYLYDDVVGKGLPFNKEYRIIRQNDGEVRWIHGLGKIEFEGDNKIVSLVGTIQDITERKTKEEALQKLNRTLAALGKSSQIMSQSIDEAEYLNKVCDIVVDDTDFAMVWIGYAEDDEAKTIRPIASAGFNDDYLDNVKVSWADNEFGRGPSGVAVRTGEMAMCNNMFTDPNFEPWREQALKRGYAASIVFPLKSGGNVFGAFAIYAKEPDSFLEDEIKLLSKLASDLAHGIITIRLRKAHEEAEIALLESHSKLSVLVEERTAELVEINRTLRITEEKYRTVADFTYNMETWIDTTGNYIYVSPSCQNVTGYSAAEFMNDSKLLINITHPDDKQMVREHFEEKIKGNIHNCNLDFRIITKEGKERWIGHSCQSVYNSNDEWIGQRGSNRNINKQKKAEMVLIESERNLRALTQRVDEVAEEERIRISREIHDEIGHLLTALKYDTEGLLNHTNLSAEQVREELTGMVSMIEALIDSVRKIATELRPGILDHMGLVAALEWKIKQFRLKNKICCQYEIEEMDVKFTKNETTFIYRILQEIFTNVTRHANATHLWISISHKDGYFTMKATDNGVGFDVQSSLQKGSLGLMGMIERAKSIGGEIQIESEPEKGTTTTFILKKQNN